MIKKWQQRLSLCASIYIKIISEGTRGTEDWSKGYYKFSFAITGINYILKYIIKENNI